MSVRRIDTVVIGAGQAGLSAAHELMRHGREFVVLEANDRVGDSWRKRWETLRLFTPACFDALPGMAFPAPSDHLPTKDEMAEYLELYAARFGLPIEFGAEVGAVSRDGDRFGISVGAERLVADHVIVATGANRVPWVPPFADGLDPAITQLHSSDYRNSEQLGPGSVLVVGAGNSGAEIALDLAGRHPVRLSGRDVGHLPFIPPCTAYRVLRRLRVDSWVGRWVAGKRSTGGDPVVRVRPEDLSDAGVERVPRVAGIEEGYPRLEDQRTLRVDHIVWATGFVRDFSWIELPVFDADGSLLHHRGVALTVPGLYFLGLPLQSTIASDLVGGVGADAAYVVDQIAARSTT